MLEYKCEITYSMVIFLLIDFSGHLFISACYLSMYWKSQHITLVIESPSVQIDSKEYEGSF